MRAKLVVFGTLALVAVGLVPIAGTALAAGAPGAALRLESATFTPTRGEAPDLPPGLTIAGYAAGRPGYYVVQFAGPVEEAWKDAVISQGVELLDYLPDFAFKARMNPAEAARVEALDGVAWVGLFQPAYKVSSTAKRDGVNLYRVRVERGADAGLTTAAVASTGAEVLQRSGEYLLVAADSSELDAVANVLDVAWIENWMPAETHNEYGAGVVIGANAANANGYDGSTQIAAVADTGLGGGTAATAHPDVPSSRIAAIRNWQGADSGGCYTVIGDGARDVDSGHGTHTAVSVVGDGDGDGVGKAAASAADLVFQAVEDYVDFAGLCGALYADGYYLMGLPDDLRALYQQAYADGARIHSNSWGSDVSGDYTVDSASTDDFVWSHPDMTITFSAGNAGVDANSNGVVDNDSIGSPATAKNAITVGASEGDRQGHYECDTAPGYASHDAYQTGQTCSSMGGNQAGFLGTAGSRWGFTAEPLRSDVTAGNAEQMAAFSSRGPTDDGRIKPDIVAPGTWVLSGYSSLYQEGYGDPVNPQDGLYQVDGWGVPYSVDYKYFGGTSMSNPLVAGAATVVRDFYQKTVGHQASAALVKATLVNSAVDLLDENNDGVDDNDYPIPNVHEGWGRVNLADATDGSHVFVDELTGVGTGGTASTSYTVGTAGAPFKVSLVWSDYPSTETAAANLVNDLDLTVTAPNGTVYRGNVFSGGWAQSGGSADRVNNVENVYVQSAAAGTWTVSVTGYNVPVGPQPYALVVDGAFGVAPNQAPAVSIVDPANGSTITEGSRTVQIAVTDEDPQGSLTVTWSVDTGGSQAASYNAATGYYEATWTAVQGSHEVAAVATDSAGLQGTASSVVTVEVAPPPSGTMHVGDLDAYASGGKGAWTATVQVLIEDGAGSPVEAATVTGAWSNGASGTSSCVTGTAGTCQVTVSGVSKRTSSVTFTVAGIAHADLTYSLGDNTDPDSDSTGTIIVVPRDAPAPPPPPPPPPPDPGSAIHIGDLDASSSSSSRGRWNASVTIAVHGSDEAPISGATVSGSWSSGGGSCTTNVAGVCTVTRSNLKGNVASETFSITDVSLSGYGYQAGANHDPDGDSDGTSITVFQP